MSGHSHDPHDQSRDDAARAAALTERPHAASSVPQRLHCGCMSGGGHHPSCPTVIGDLARLRAAPAPPPAAADDGLRERIAREVVRLTVGDEAEQVLRGEFWPDDRREAYEIADAILPLLATMRAENYAKTAEIARLESGRCGICGTPLNILGRPWTHDCGGDCAACMADAGDPDAIATISGGVSA